MAQYQRFLPTGDLCEPLADAVFFFIGDQLEWEVELAIPAGEVIPSRLGSFGQLGWTSWMSPNWSSTDPYRCDSRFHPSERVKRKNKLSA
jgi:type VI secretion system protein ImpH